MVDRPPPRSRRRISLRLLGELEVILDGARALLPHSRKTRALLGYLAASSSPQAREHLCDLLFEGPDDPRGALRWSLSRLRPLLGDYLRADRDHVELDLTGIEMDLHDVYPRAGNLDSVSLDDLQCMVTLFRGPFLAGLDVGAPIAFEQWCAAERDRTRDLQVRVLAALVSRLSNQPADALPFARQRVALAPYSEEAHADLIRLLIAGNRTSDALDHYDRTVSLFSRDMGRIPGHILENARRTIRAESRAVSMPAAPRAGPSAHLSPLIGREGERVRLREFLDARTPLTKLLLVTGEPGIGKSRLLAELAEIASSHDAPVLIARAFEAEMVRPYGPWIDALRQLDLSALPHQMRHALATILPELSDTVTLLEERGPLFDAVVEAIRSGIPPSASLLIILDDVQWLDEASTALLHYVSRRVSDARVFLAVAARTAELGENVAMQQCLASVRRDARLVEMPLTLLDAADTERLAATVLPGLPAENIYSGSGGNPLYTLEMSRAIAHGAPERPMTLEGLIRDRFARLTKSGRRAVAFAAALGHDFSAETLGRVGGLTSIDVLGVVDELERHGLIRVVQQDTVKYDFTHDVTRAAAYGELSTPRRTLIHREIARALVTTMASDDAVAGDVARHAALGGDEALAAHACLIAAERCVRMVAREDAIRLARQGLSHTAALPAADRIRIRMGLYRSWVHSGATQSGADDIEDAIQQLANEARDAGAHETAQMGFYLVSYLHYRTGSWEMAHEDTLRAVAEGRAAGAHTAIRALANSARCLLQIDRDLPHARELLEEARTLAAPAEPQILDYQWALGLFAHASGDSNLARYHYRRTVEIARADGDHFAECDCLIRLVRLDLEEQRWQDALRLSEEMIRAAARMGEGSELPFAHALTAIARRALGEAKAGEEIADAAAALERIDATGLAEYVHAMAAAVTEFSTPTHTEAHTVQG